MTDKALKNLVSEAANLDRELSTKSDRLKELKAQLVSAARMHENELLPTGGGGLRWIVEGNDGCVARVNFPALALKAKIEAEGKTIEVIKKLAGNIFNRLFIPTLSFKPVAAFRDEALSLLTKADAKKLIKLCETESAPRVSFETAERAALNAAA